MRVSASVGECSDIAFITADESERKELVPFLMSVSSFVWSVSVTLQLRVGAYVYHL